MAMILRLKAWINVFEPQKSGFAFREPSKFLSRNVTKQNSIILLMLGTGHHNSGKDMMEQGWFCAAG